ncbi:MAG TPA: hypothetical protein PKE06_25370 [Flavilitoribacter sp.]|nr:hypothetical protein [Flavilitoribacter sp.]
MPPVLTLNRVSTKNSSWIKSGHTGAVVVIFSFGFQEKAPPGYDPFSGHYRPDGFKTIVFIWQSGIRIFGVLPF